MGDMTGPRRRVRSGEMGKRKPPQTPLDHAWEVYQRDEKQLERAFGDERERAYARASVSWRGVLGALSDQWRPHDELACVLLVGGDGATVERGPRASGAVPRGLCRRLLRAQNARLMRVEAHGDGLRVQRLS